MRCDTCKREVRDGEMFIVVRDGIILSAHCMDCCRSEVAKHDEGNSKSE